MPVISAAIVTKSSKILVSRQFTDITRIRIEGLLSAFPKLVGTGSKQFTFLDSGSVRYVYQPVEDMYLVLVTTPGGNIIEDLSTLRMIGRLLPEYVSVMTEEAVSAKAFELMFAMDEVVTNGCREAVSLDQVVDLLEMHSREEDMAKEEEDRKRKEASAVAKKKAKELKKKKMEMEMDGGGGGGYSEQQHRPEPLTPLVGDGESSAPIAEAARPKASGGGMSLGKGRKKDGASKVLMESGAPAEVAGVPQPTAAQHQQQQQQAAVSAEPVHVKIDETISVALNRDGGTSGVDISGTLFVTVSDPDAALVRLQLPALSDDVNFKTHPNVNKVLFGAERVLGIKDNKPYPMQQALGILRWRAQSLGKLKVPLSINCWPGDNSASIEFELENTAMVLHNVVISLPLGGAFPTVGDVTSGSYEHDQGESVLHWVIPRIDASCGSGTMDVELNTAVGDAFFPTRVQFSAAQTMTGVSILSATHTETHQPVPFSTELNVSTDEYIVV